MSGKKSYYTITSADLDCIERLYERPLAPKLRAGLMRLYGEDGELAKYLDIIDACDVTDESHCTEEGCSLCAYPSSDSLLTQIYLIVLCYDRGLFNPERDIYRSVSRKCSVRWTADEEDDPELFF
jgi:hypothetical protein